MTQSHKNTINVIFEEKTDYEHTKKIEDNAEIAGFGSFAKGV